MGEFMGVTFFYRSKHALQILGCIPKDPSPGFDPINATPSLPASEHPSVAEDQPDINGSERDRQITALKAQLALLERNRNVKVEPSTASPPGSNAEIKRGYDGVEVIGHKRVRPTGSMETETVDLTDG